MKPLTNLIIAIVVLSISCNKKVINEVETPAVIMGLDEALCICCGGWVIQLDRAQNLRQFSTVPIHSNINLENETFPLDVWVNWTEDPDNPCQLILIEGIRKR